MKTVAEINKELASIRPNEAGITAAEGRKRAKRMIALNKQKRAAQKKKKTSTKGR